MKLIPLRVNHRKYAALKDNVFAMVDDVDYERLVCLGNWRIGNSGYAEIQTSINGKEVTILMHRVVMDAKKGKQVDHIDSNRLNNQKENLRFSTQQQNVWNARPRKNCTSKFKGICWSKNAKKWRAQIKVDGKTKHIGYFDSEVNAANAYDEKAGSFFGQFAYLNTAKQ
jgi:hypothetical protein